MYLNTKLSLTQVTNILNAFVQFPVTVTMDYL